MTPVSCSRRRQNAGRRQTGRGDIDVDVERAARPDKGQVERRQRLHQRLAPVVVDVAHLRDAILRAGQGGERRHLGDGRSADRQRVFDFQNGADVVGRTRQIADAPAGHRVALGEAIDDKRALAHPRWAAMLAWVPSS